MKKLALLGAAVLVLALAVPTTWYYRCFRVESLSPDQLEGKRPDTGLPLRNDCSEKRRVLLKAFGSNFRPSTARKSLRALSSDENAIYRAALSSWNSGEGHPVNVSLDTFPLDPTSPADGLSECDCLRYLDLENLRLASQTFHRLTPEALPGGKMHLVNPTEQAAIVNANDPDRLHKKGKTLNKRIDEAFDAGLLSISEIAFDKEHRHAVVSIAFWCGGRCGHGRTMVLEKVGGEWKTTEHSCGGWVS